MGAEGTARAKTLRWVGIRTHLRNRMKASEAEAHRERDRVVGQAGEIAWEPVRCRTQQK